MLRSETELSTKTAPIRRSTSRSTSLADPVQTGLAFGRNALNADHLEPVGRAEIAEGVMRGHQHARGFGNACQNVGA